MKMTPTTQSLLKKAGVVAVAVLAIAALRFASGIGANPASVDRAGSEQAASGQGSAPQPGPLLAVARSILPDAFSAKTASTGKPVELLNKSGATIGFAVDASGMPGLTQGYNGPVPVAVILDSDGRILGIRPMGNDETPSYMDSVNASGFLDTLNGKTIAEALAIEHIDTVSGATYTSRAMIDSTRTALASVAGFRVQPRGRDWFAIAVQVACAAVLGFALVCWAMPRRLGRLRPILMVANVAVPGLLGGVFLSTALFWSWIVNGPSLARPMLVAAVSISILLPLLTGRQFWCTHACPFGSASELFSKIPLPRKVPGSVARGILGWVGAAYLLAVPAIALLQPEFDLAQLEPFPAFSILAAPAASLAIALVFLVLSAFIPKVWCRFLCPTGRVVNFFTTGGKIFANSVKK